MGKYSLLKILPWFIYNAANLSYDVANHIDLLVSFSGSGIMDALTFGNNTGNLTREDCIWRRGNDQDQCPDPKVRYYLHTAQSNGWTRQAVDLKSDSWVRESNHDPNRESVILVHGYAGISDVLPMGVLRDAYLTNGSYNVYVVDWSPLCPIPCYAAAVHNMRSVARCLAAFLTHLRHSGVDMRRTTCVGHSLGAHMCGVASNYLQFRLHKIIGIDPARPLIRSQPKARLDPGDARVVQVIHTSSTFGDARRSGHVDFCVNGGRVQPFCANASNEAICSHVRSVCYLAESLNGNRAQIGVPCLRRCLNGNGSRRPSFDSVGGLTVPMGHSTPDWVDGIFCVNTNVPPYCPTPDNPIGNPLCCVPPKKTLASNTI